MRLTEFEITAIKESAKALFGERVSVSLFGSRVNDARKGGDIDLFISGVDACYLSSEIKIEFLVRLKSIIGDQKIDVIYDIPYVRSKTAFYPSIQQTALPL